MKKLVDKLIGIPTCFILSLLSPMISNKQKGSINNILIIRLYGMGDAIISTGLVNAMKENFPNSRITVLTTNETKKVYGFSNVNKILAWDTRLLGIIPSFVLVILELRNEKFDVVLDLEQFARISSIFALLSGAPIRIGYTGFGKDLLYTGKVRYNGDVHTLECFFDLLRFLKKDAKAKLPEIIPKQIFKDKVTKIFLENGMTDKTLVVGLHPGTGDTATMRRWFPERFAELADEISKKYNAKIILTGVPSEKELLEKISSSMKTKPLLLYTLKFEEFICLLSELDLFICNDTGPLHLASAIGTPSIGIFGSTSPIRWAPLGKKCIVVYSGFPCSPCIHTHLEIIPSKCPLYATTKCMEAIEVKDVMEKVDELME